MSRPLSEIPFTDVVADTVRHVFELAGAQTDEDIVELGCTGLVSRLVNRDLGDSDTCWRRACSNATFVIGRMAGSGCGLPCYVPPTRFCLIHNTIGGLQRGQAPRHEDFALKISRELNAEEKKHAAAVQAEVDRVALVEAENHFGAEQTVEFTEPNAGSTDDPVSPLTPTFRCPEHALDKPVWKCRYCLAAQIIHGPFEPSIVLRSYKTSDAFSEPKSEPVEILDRIQSLEHASEVELLVRVARWNRRLVLE